MGATVRRNRRGKSFNGCWTCRSRKIKCDQQHPACLRCRRAKLICGGYDIKLQWSAPVKFDAFGSLDQDVENNSTGDNESVRRRNIAFVHYEKRYEYYEEMDEELTLLHAPPCEKISDGKLWLIDKFGVFRGTSPEPDVLRNAGRCYYHQDDALQLFPINHNKEVNTTQCKEIKQPTARYSIDDGPNFYDYEMAMVNSIGSEWISNELKDDAILSAFALQGSSTLFDHYNSPLGDQVLTPINLQTQNNMELSYHDDDKSIQRTLKLLFHQNTSPMDELYSMNLCNNVRKDTFKSPDHECVEPLPRSLFERNERTSGVTSGYQYVIHEDCQKLLSHYYDNVADLMTVVRLTINPWKHLYFSRAVNGLGEICALGKTSYSKVSLLNALLAVSCFNLQSRYPKNSTQQIVYLELGVRLRTKAIYFLKTCLNETSDHMLSHGQYKDFLTAMLSMNTIDVVWGTMADCQTNLARCEDFIKANINEIPSVTSGKIKTLHRIFAFLKLVQDSTSLDKLKLHENPCNKIDDVKGVLDSTKVSLVMELLRESARESPKSLYSDYFLNDASHQIKPSRQLVPGIDILYGLPHSLLILFARIVEAAWVVWYCGSKNIGITDDDKETFKTLTEDLTHWSSEWNFFQESETEKNDTAYINSTFEAIHYHTLSFYNGLMIYFHTMVLGTKLAKLQAYVCDTLKYVQKMMHLVHNNKVNMVPLFWQGFIAGCACTSRDLQTEFKQWSANLAQSGMGSYWGARQVMFEVWRRHLHEEEGADWFSVYHDWEMNLMLT